jgi:ABC-2 type transport system permease protein
VSVEARIIDRGYRPYDGPRWGQRGAVRSLIRHTAQRVMGLRRTFPHKILPILSAAIAYVPAIVFIGLAAFIKEPAFRRNLPTYGQYYGFIVSALVVFACFVAPEALCPDRRTGLFGMYLASPLTRGTYVVAKVVAVAGLLAVATLGPPLLMLVAYVLQGIGPDGPVAVAQVLGRVVAAGLLVAGVYTAVSLAISSFTDRRALASAGTLIAIVGTGVVSGVLVESAGLPQWLYAFDLSSAPFLLVQRIYGEVGPADQADVGTLALVAGNGLWLALGAVLIWWRYHRIEVTR